MQFTEQKIRCHVSESLQLLCALRQLNAGHTLRPRFLTILTVYYHLVYLLRFCKILLYLDIVWTVYHLVIYMQSNKIHSVVLMSKFIQHLC